MRLLLRALLPLLLVVSLVAQHPASNGWGKCAIEGMVVKDQGGEPLKKATIQVIAEDQEGSNYTAVTDPEGQFKIDAIQPGHYHVLLEHTGFIEIDKYRHHSSGTELSLQAGQELKDLVLRMVPASVITGRVVDEDGDPMPNVEIAVLRYGYASGRRRLDAERSERTNDVGEYRIGGLFPGHYYISASPAPEFISLGNSKERAESPGKPDTGYVTTYYPDTTDRSQAAALELHAGEETPVNFTLVPAHTFRVRGRVANVAGTALPGTNSKDVVMLRVKDFSEVFSAAEVDKDGKFEIRGVAPGSYTLMLMTGDGETPQLSRQSLEVSNADVNNVRIAPIAGSEILGQLRIENNRKTDLGDFSVFLRARDGTDKMASGFTSFAEGSQTAARIKSDGSFELKNVPAGTYTVLVAGGSKPSPHYFLKKVVVGGHDVTETGIRVGGGGVLGVDLIVSPNAGFIEGTVVDDKDQPVGSAVVVAVPDADHRQQIDRYQKAFTDQRGHFALDGLYPGEYMLLGWVSLEEDAYYDPECLKRYETGGKTVRVIEGGRQSVLLRALPAAEE